MSTNSFTKQVQHRLFTLSIAVLLALATLCAQVALDNVAGTAFTPQAHACQSATGGC